MFILFLWLLRDSLDVVLNLLLSSDSEEPDFFFIARSRNILPLAAIVINFFNWEMFALQSFVSN